MTPRLHRCQWHAPHSWSSVIQGLCCCQQQGQHEPPPPNCLLLTACPAWLSGCVAAVAGSTCALACAACSSRPSGTPVLHAACPCWVHCSSKTAAATGSKCTLCVHRECYITFWGLKPPWFFKKNDIFLQTWALPQVC